MPDTSVFDRERAKRHPTYSLYFRRYAPFKTFGGILPPPLTTFARFSRFDGDNRSASTSLQVTSRTYGMVMFDEDGVIYHFANADFTKISPHSEEIIGHAKVSSTVVESMAPFPHGFDFSASTAGSMPLIPGSPDINTFINVTVDFNLPGYFKISGEVFGDNFPNLEVFLICNRSHHTALLLDGQTTGGRDTGPMSRLYTSHEDFSLGNFSATLPLSDDGQLKFNSSVRPTTLPDYMPIP